MRKLKPYKKIVRTSYEYRLYPDRKAENFFAQNHGCRRKIYNENLQSLKEGTGFLLETDLKKEFPFLKEADSVALQQARRDLQQGLQNYKENPGHFGFPVFKKKSDQQTYRTVATRNNIKIDFETRKLTLPKVGPVSFRGGKTFDGKIKNVTVKKMRSDKYFAKILVEEEIEITPVMARASQSTGIDMSLVNSYVDKNGYYPPYVKEYKKREEQLKLAQQVLNRKQKRSSNRRKARLKVAKIHEKIANIRKDFRHKETTKIANFWDSVCCEDLALEEMKQSAFRLAASVTDVSWDLFVKALEYKLERRGKVFYQVSRWFPSSKQCSVCGEKNDALTLSDRDWDCPCGAVHDRDVNAARNLTSELLKHLKSTKRLSKETAGTAGIAFGAAAASRCELESHVL